MKHNHDPNRLCRRDCRRSLIQFIVARRTNRDWSVTVEGGRSVSLALPTPPSRPRLRGRPNMRPPRRPTQRVARTTAISSISAAGARAPAAQG
jgi:hypothetical protein